MIGHPLIEECPVDVETGELLPVVTIVTDNGGPFRSFRFEAFIELHPELHHVRTRVGTPDRTAHANVARDLEARAAVHRRDRRRRQLAKHAEEYRLEYNHIRPHEAIAWNRPQEVHKGLADPKISAAMSRCIIRYWVAVSTTASSTLSADSAATSSGEWSDMKRRPFRCRVSGLSTSLL